MENASIIHHVLHACIKFKKPLQDTQDLLLQADQLCLQTLNIIHDLLLTWTSAQNMLNLRQPKIFVVCRCMTLLMYVYEVYTPPTTSFYQI